MANPQAALRRKAVHDPATPRGPRGLTASVKLDRGPEYGAGRESTPLRRHFRPQSWPGAAGPPLPGPRPTGTEEGERQALRSAWASLSVLPAWGPGTFTPSAQGQLLPALSFYPPQPAPGPETRVAPHTRDELHANLSATPAGGARHHTDRSSPWETRADKLPVFSTCLHACPGGICLGFQKLPCAMSPEPAVGPGGGSGQTNSAGIPAALPRQPRLRHGDPRTPSTPETLSAMPASGSDTPKHRGLLPTPSLATWSAAS